MSERETSSVKVIKQDKGDWMQTKWRPMMAVTYMAINIMDFILFPILFTLVQFWEVQAANDAFRQWQPLTLQGGGFIHMAFGAILGISAWTRGKEKVADIERGGDGGGYNNGGGYNRNFNQGYGDAPVESAPVDDYASEPQYEAPAQQEAPSVTQDDPDRPKRYKK